jgi:hypothetical protein
MTLFLYLTTYLSSVIDTESKTIIPEERLELANEVILTTDQGVFIPCQLLEAKLGKQVKIYRPDGFCYIGKVTSLTRTKTSFKILGQITNLNDAGFGFAVTSDGKIAGAVLEQKTKKLYVLAYATEANCFILIPGEFPPET